MGLKPAENGEPEDRFRGRGAENSNTPSGSAPATSKRELLHASAAHGDTSASTRDAADTTLPIRRPPSTMKAMKSEPSKTFSDSVFYEQAPEGGYVAFVPALPDCHTQG